MPLAWLFLVEVLGLSRDNCVLVSPRRRPWGLRGERRQSLLTGRSTAGLRGIERHCDTGEMSALFTPLTIREVTFRNRIGVSPMCQYSSDDGFANDWHLVHLGSRAAGGAGLVIMEASAVEARGRISPQDNGIWKDEHIEFLRRIAAFLRSQGAVAAIQLAHAGRKASTYRPWDGNGAVSPQAGGWQPVAPSPLPFQPDYAFPAELTRAEIAGLAESFAAAAGRALQAGFQVVELHFAHGYLMHEFLSPLSNRRSDEYGGPFENRIRFALETARAVRAGLARTFAAIRAHLGQRLGGRRMGYCRIRGTVAASVRLGGRSDRLLVRWPVAAAKDLAVAGLSGAVCRAHPSRGRNPDGGRGAHYRTATGR